MATLGEGSSMFIVEYRTEAGGWEQACDVTGEMAWYWTLEDAEKFASRIKDDIEDDDVRIVRLSFSGVVS